MCMKKREILADSSFVVRVCMEVTCGAISLDFDSGQVNYQVLVHRYVYVRDR